MTIDIYEYKTTSDHLRVAYQSCRIVLHDNQPIVFFNSSCLFHLLFSSFSRTSDVPRVTSVLIKL